MEFPTKVGGGGQHLIFHKEKKVRLSRVTLELQVPTGLKVFSSQVIYLFSLTKIFRSKKPRLDLSRLDLSSLDLSPLDLPHLDLF